jgi:hypothetical protein
VAFGLLLLSAAFRLAGQDTVAALIMDAFGVGFGCYLAATNKGAMRGFAIALALGWIVLAVLRF